MWYRYLLAVVIAISLGIVIDLLFGKFGVSTIIFSCGIVTGVIWAAVVREW